MGAITSLALPTIIWLAKKILLKLTLNRFHSNKSDHRRLYKRRRRDDIVEIIPSSAQQVKMHNSYPLPKAPILLIINNK